VWVKSIVFLLLRGVSYWIRVDGEALDQEVAEGPVLLIAG